MGSASAVYTPTALRTKAMSRLVDKDALHEGVFFVAEGYSGKSLETMVVADAPARALVLFGDGLMQSVSPTHSNLHALAASGACGFLALRHCPPH
ncbi:hypothetical protein L7F22_051099, partial [Adiantum nelumboides]|nr:hypothetical protein [Adiantum nelumboides]